MTTQRLDAPQAARRPVERVHHGDVFVDDYEWLRDKSDPEVIAHLEAENAYTEAQLAGQAELRETIYGEIKSRTKETDLSIPVRDKNWWYYSRTVEGQQYAVSCRAPYSEGDVRPVPVPGESLPGEQVLLDGNVEAAGQEFFSIGGLDITPDESRLAVLVDTEGDERYSIMVRDIADGTVIDDAVSDVGYGFVWTADGSAFYYTRVDDSWRPYQVWRHELGQDVETDVLVYEEPDASYWLGIGGTHDDAWLIISVGSKNTAEFQLLDLRDPSAQPQYVQRRIEGLDYDIEIDGDRLYVVHNRDRVDYDIAVTTIGNSAS